MEADVVGTHHLCCSMPLLSQTMHCYSNLPHKQIKTHRIIMKISYSLSIGILVLSFLSHRFYSKYYDSTPCSLDPPIEIDGIGWGNGATNGRYTFRDSCTLFSTEYVEARAKFRAAVKAYNATLEDKGEVLELWSSLVSKKDGEPFSLEVAVIPGNSAKLGTIVHSSGVHGVEGYAGSSIQLALLELFTSLSKQKESGFGADDRPTVVLVHVVNPVGMSQYRRYNENNIDLNRNGIILTEGNDRKDEHRHRDDGIYRSFREFVDKRDPNIAGYDDFRDLFVPTVKETGINHLSFYENTIGYFARAIPAIARYGLPALKRGMVAGQYHHPEGLNYGGQSFQPSLERLLDVFVRDRPEFFLESSRVIWIDVHTGLGPFGKDSVLRHAHSKQPKKEEGEKCDLELDDYLTTAYSVTSSVAGGQSTAQAFKGYDLSKGMLMEFLGDKYQKIVALSNNSGRDDNEGDTTKSSDKEAIFLVQEFGTLPTILVGRALILDNMLYQYQKSRHQTKERFVYKSPYLGYAFYPQSTEWRRSLVQRGVAIVLQAMEYSAARSKLSC